MISTTGKAWPHVGTLALLGVTLVFVGLAEKRVSEPLAAPLETLPREIGGFTATENPALTEGVLGQLRPTAYVSRTYRRGDLSLDLFIAYYSTQRAGESMHSPKHCLPGAGWEIWNHGTAPIAVNGGKIVLVNDYSITRDGQRMAVLYWYQSKTRLIASEYWGKVLLAHDALLQNSTAGSIVRIVVPDRPADVRAGQLFAAEVIPQVQRCFGN
jgi:EpsI family protein